jgi:hypothetical protein
VDGEDDNAIVQSPAFHPARFFSSARSWEDTLTFFQAFEQRMQINLSLDETPDLLLSYLASIRDGGSHGEMTTKPFYPFSPKSRVVIL